MTSDRIEKLRTLAERGATEGERNAAKKALERIGSRAPESFSEVEWNDIIQELFAAIGKTGSSLKNLARAFEEVNKAMSILSKTMVKAKYERDFSEDALVIGDDELDQYVEYLTYGDGA